jgi:probable F420-dependent oxidoreductase
VKFGLSLGRVNPRLWLDLTIEAERVGFESVWLPEHLVLPAQMAGSPFAGEEHPPVPPSTPVYDAPAYLSFLAAKTSTIRLGTWVYLLNLRHPFTTARGFATLDLVSQGRTELGVGAGWLRSEWEAVGLDFHTRGRRLDEAIDVCRKLWADEVVEHHGEFYDFDAVMFEPKPPQQPLPILVGGESKPALRRAVERGDGWLGMLHTPESAGPIAKELRAARGNAFSVSVGADVRTPADVERFADVGVDRLIVAPWQRSSQAMDGILRFADTMMSP